MVPNPDRVDIVSVVELRVVLLPNVAEVSDPMDIVPNVVRNRHRLGEHCVSLEAVD